MAKDFGFLDQWRSPSEIAEEIRMLSGANPHMACVLVEGEDDLKLFERLLDNSRCQIISASTSSAKKDVLEVAKRLSPGGQNRHVRSFVGIVDSDFDAILNRKSELPSVVYTDGYSLENMLVRHVRWQRITSELRVKLETGFKERILKATSEIGLLRLISMRNRFGLRFKGLDAGSYVEPISIRLDSERLVNAVLNNTPEPHISASVVRQKLENDDPGSYDPWHLCNGHDLVSVLAACLRARTNPTKLFVNANWLAGALRMTHDEISFGNTKTYRDLRLWQSSHSPFTVLEDPSAP